VSGCPPRFTWRLIGAAVLAPRALGAQVTVFDPDLDPDGSHARRLTDILVTDLAPLSRDRR
jgi:arginase